MKNLKITILILCLLIFSSFAFAMQLFVPINDPVYDFLERQATRGYIPEFMNDTKPLQRDDIAFWLLKVQSFSNKLHKTDKELLREYIGEYRHDLTDEKHPDLSDTSHARLGFANWKTFSGDIKDVFTNNIYEEDKHIYVYEDDVNTVWVDADLMVRGEGKDSILRFMDQLGAYASIQAGDHLSMYVNGYFFHQYMPDNWREPVKEAKGQWINVGGDIDKIATWDRSEAYANLTGDFGTLTIAHYPVNWGNSLNSVILSDNAINFGSIRWSKQFKHFKYNFLHGSLMTPTYETMSDSGRYYIPKYFVGHRIEIMFSPRIHFNFTEMVNYGGEDRVPEVTYLVPPIFLYSSEHTLGDRDNKMVVFETELFPLNGLRLFGTLFMDELVFGQIFKDWWGNKYALQAGFQWSPRSIPADLIVEATAVHPWTYTHRFVFGNHAHRGRELGFFAGPNSQNITAKLNYDLSARNRLSLSFDYLLEGADYTTVDGITYPVGGDVNSDDYDRYRAWDNSTTWLMGDITKTTSLKLDWLYRWRNEVSFLTSCELRNVQGVCDIYYSLQLNLNY